MSKNKYTIDFPPAVWSFTQRRGETPRLKDPRVLMFSCADLGGTDGADDWMVKLTGGGEKYSPLGLDLFRSLFSNTHRVGTLHLAVRFGDCRITEWGNLDCQWAYADRVVMGTPFWGVKELAAVIEILMLGPGCCRLGVTLRNQSDAPRDVDIEFAFQTTDFQTVVLKERQQVDGDGWSIATRVDAAAAGLLEPGKTAEMSILLSAGETPEKARDGLIPAGEVDLEAFRNKQEALCEPAALEQFAGEHRELAGAVYNVLRTNVIRRNETFFTAPNRVIHKGQWLWDSCFHAFVWNLFDPTRTAELLENLFAYQEEDTGFIPINTDATHGVTTYASQPPLIAHAVDALVESRDVRERLYPKLQAFYKWFETNRRLENGLYRWNTAGESGMDNSPRFDDDPTHPSSIETLNFCGRQIEAPIAHIDLSSMMVQFADAMGNLADSLGRTEEADSWRHQAEALRKTINEFLYDPGDGFYYDRHSDGSWRKIKTVASFWPLATGVCEPTHARAVVEHLMHPDEFFTAMPIPSVALNEPAFCFNYWRGPVWINTCYVTIQGLQRYGFVTEAKEIVRRVVHGIQAEYLRGGQFYELYDPLGGPASAMRKKYAGPRENAMLFGGWTANVLNILRETR